MTAVARGTVVATVADVEAADGWLRVDVDGEPWLLVRLDGALHAVRDLCPHRRVPLSAGQRVTTADGERVECGYHGWQFEGRGACTAIPALGPGAAVPRGMVARAAALRVVDGLVVLESA